jgi:hypothetical protein
MKLKVTLSYKQPPGVIGLGLFQNVQVDIKVPNSVLIEKKVIKFQSLSLAGSTTPPTEQIFLYA